MLTIRLIGPYVIFASTFTEQYKPGLCQLPLMKWGCISIDWAMQDRAEIPEATTDLKIWAYASQILHCKG